MKVKQRVLALMLSVMMVITYMPAIAFAETDEVAGTDVPEVTDVQPAEDEAAEEAAPAEPAEEEAQAEEPAAEAATEEPEEAAEGEEADEQAVEAEDPAEETGEAQTVEAEEPEAVEMQTFTVEPQVSKAEAEVDLADSDELLMGYMEKSMGSKTKTGMLKASRKTRGEQLEGNDKEVYDILKWELSVIASGENNDATIQVALEDINQEAYQESYTADDLGVDAIVVDGAFNKEAADAMNRLFNFDFEKVLNALLADMPYELYWFDKTSGCVQSGPGIGASGIGDEWTANFTEPYFTFYFSGAVAEEYRGEKTGTFSGGGYEIDLYTVARTDKVSTAIDTAQDIRDRYVDSDDLDKLVGYKNEICDLTTYNHSAAENESTPYGNPWQMIWVFDGDDSTNVVCEGYSKAFQFLCDSTSFDDSRIECDSVSGKMEGATGAGDHMWNILHMDDGRNYVADITNCDEGSVGAPDQLFLKGYSDGDVGGYYYSCGGDTVYYSYDEKMFDQFTEKELTMSDTDYSGGSSLEISYQTSRQFVENTDGGWEEREYYDESGESVTEEFYYYSIEMKKGDVLTVDGKEYTFDDEAWSFIAEDGSKIDGENVEINNNQFDNPWVIPEGEEETVVAFTVEYMGSTCQAEAVLVKNPISGISFTPVNEYADLMEEVDGRYEDGIFCYDIPYFEEGDTLTVFYRDDTEQTYVYSSDEEAFLNTADEEDRIGGWTLDEDADQSEPWTVTGEGEYYEKTVTYKGYTAVAKKIRILENPVDHISFSRNGENRLELIDGQDSYTATDWENNEETFERFYLNFRPGDVITLHMKDGTAVEYVFYEELDDIGFVNADGDKIYYGDADDYFSSEQSYENEWKIGGSYTANLLFYGRTTDVNVTILPNPVTNVVFKRSGSTKVELIEGVDGYIGWDTVNDHDISYFHYEFPYYREGDTLTITENGITKEYEYVNSVYNEKYDYYDDAFVSLDDSEIIYADDIEELDTDQGAMSLWTRQNQSGNYHFNFKCKGFKYSVPAEIIENPVSAFSFLRAGYDEEEPIELTECIDGRINSDGGKNLWFEYFLRFKNGDTIKVTGPDNNISDYNAVPDTEDPEGIVYFENNEGKKIDPSDISQKTEQSFDNQWMPGDGDHEINLNLYTRPASVKVKIKENPVKEIAFSRPDCDAIPLVDHVDGYEDDRDFRYEIKYKAGDELYVTYAGTDEPVKYVAEADEYGSVYEFAASEQPPEGAAQSISAYDLQFRHNFDYQLRYLDEDETAHVLLIYNGRWVDVPVELVENPYTSLSFSREGYDSDTDPIELIENVNGYTAIDGEGNSYFCYYLAFKEGDVLTLNDEEYVYRCLDEDNGYLYFVNEETGEYFDDKYIEQDSNMEAWEPGIHTITLKYSGLTCPVTVNVVRSNVKAITFDRPGVAHGDAIEIPQIIDEGYYSFSFRAGDVLTVTYDLNGSDTDVTYTFVEEERDDEWVSRFEADGEVPEGVHEYIELDETFWADMYYVDGQLAPENWTLGEVYNCELSYMGIQYMIPVKIVKVNRPVSMTWTKEGDPAIPRAMIGEDYLLGDDFYHEGNTLEITFEDESVQTYICREKEDEDGSHVGYFLDGDTSKEELIYLSVEVDNEDGLFAEGENFFRIIAEVNGVEISTEPYAANGVEDPYHEEHEWSEWTETRPATCSVEGEETRTCSLCGETETRSIDIDPDAHDWSEPEYAWESDNSLVTASRICGNNPGHVEIEAAETTCEIIKEATETEEGEELYTATFENEAFETQTKSVTTPVIGHQHSPVHTAAIAATCTTDGNLEYWSCRCGKYFSDAEGNTEIEKDSWVIKATGHEYGAWTKLDDSQHQRVCSHDASHVEKADHNWDAGEITKEPGCTEKGIRTFTCDACGATKTEEVAALGHDFGAWTKLDDSQHQRVCSHDATHVEKAAHSWDAGEITKEPSCTEKGIRTFTCSVCRATKTEEIAATGHDFGAWTKLDDDQHQRVCSHDDSHVETAAHSWNAGEVTTPATVTTPGVMTYRCSVCDATKTETIPATGPSPVDDAISEANDQTDEAADKADAAENSTDESVVNAAEEAAAKAVELAEKAEESAEKAQAAAQAALDNLPASASEEERAIAQANLDNATMNLVVAKQIKAAASSAMASSKKSAARVAASKAAAASEAAANAPDSATAETYRKEAEAYAAKAAAEAAAAETASKDASDAAADATRIAQTVSVNDPAVKAEIEAAKAKASASASEAGKAAETASKDAGNAAADKAAAEKAATDKAAAEKAAAEKAAAEKAAAEKAAAEKAAAEKAAAEKAAAEKATAEKAAAEKAAAEKAAAEKAAAEKAAAEKAAAEKAAAEKAAAEKAAAEKAAAEKAAAEKAAAEKAAAEKAAAEKAAAKTALDSAVTDAKEIEQGIYSDESYAVLKDAIAEAEKLTADPDATAEQLKAAAANIEAAKDALAIKADPAEEYGEDGTAVGPGASAEAAEEAITSLPNDNDPEGAKFAPMMLKSTKQTNTSIKLTWKKVKGAKKYVIYGNKCGKKNKPKKLTTVKGSSKTVKKAAGKKLKKGTYYKFMVVALDSNNKVLSTSKIIHVATKGKANHTKVTTKAKKNKVTLKKGKTFKLGAKAVGKNVKKHVAVRYESSNPKVAKVSKSGKITAKKKGTCKIYVYAQNGLCKTIKVTVKK